MKDLIDELNLPTKLPQYSKKITSFVIPNSIWNLSARFKLDFEINKWTFNEEKVNHCWGIFNNVFNKFLKRSSRYITREPSFKPKENDDTPD